MKKTIVTFLFALPVLFLSLNVKAQTADEIIDKYIAAIGGKDKWTKVTSMKINGYIEVQGIKINFIQQAVHNVGMRVDAEFQGQKVIDITTPTKGWSQNPFAGRSTLQPISDEELQQKLDELDLQDKFVNYAAKGSTVEFLGKDEEDGNEFYKIKLTTKNKNESVFFFDVNTYMIYKEEETVKQQGQEMKMVTKMFDYKGIPFGIKFPHKMDQMGQVFVITSVEINPAIDESIFKGN